MNLNHVKYGFDDIALTCEMCDKQTCDISMTDVNIS